MGSIEEVRERILGRLIRVIAIAGAIAYLPSVYLSIISRLWLVVAVDTLAFALLITASVWKGAGFKLRIAVLVGSSLAIAGVVLLATGPYGAGYVWLIGAIFLAVLLAGARLIAVAIAASAAILCAYAALGAARLIPFGQPLASLGVLAVNLAFVCALLALAARGLIKGLEGAYSEESRLAARVSEELEAAHAAEAALNAEMGTKEKLLRELHHRVRNNMQVVLSLLDIESATGDAGSIARMRRRVRALSLANDQILSDPDAATADLYHLVAGAMINHRASGEAEELFSSEGFVLDLPIDYLAGYSVAIADILASLGEMRLRVAVGIEGREGSRSLTFSWASAPGAGDAARAARLCSDPVVAGLTAPFGLSFEPGAAGGSARLRLALPAG